MVTQQIRKPRESPRDRLIDTVLSLFSRHGFHATGIDTILAETGVAKMTRYQYFASKDELILAALERQGAEFRDWLTERVNVSGRAPRDRLLATVTAAGEWCANPQYTGCIFVNGSRGPSCRRPDSFGRKPAEALDSGFSVRFGHGIGSMQSRVACVSTLDSHGRCVHADSHQRRHRVCSPSGGRRANADRRRSRKNRYAIISPDRKARFEIAAARRFLATPPRYTDRSTTAELPLRCGVTLLSLARTAALAIAQVIGL